MGEYGLVFRVGNKRHRKYGRLTVFGDSWGDASRFFNDEWSRELAVSPGGFLVPLRVADRMMRRKHRRSLGWTLAGIWHNLPSKH